jgi:hypothetical protein
MVGFPEIATIFNIMQKDWYFNIKFCLNVEQIFICIFDPINNADIN